MCENGNFSSALSVHLITDPFTPRKLLKITPKNPSKDHKSRIDAVFWELFAGPAQKNHDRTVFHRTTELCS